MAKYGLIGRNLAFSFSKTFFTTKFEQEKRRDTYHNFSLKHIDELPRVIAENPGIKGLNVTIPFKESVMPLLDRIDKEAPGVTLSSDGKRRLIPPEWHPPERLRS